MRWGLLENKLHLVRRDITCMGKFDAGFGIRKLSFLNKVLLGK